MRVRLIMPSLALGLGLLLGADAPPPRPASGTLPLTNFPFGPGRTEKAKPPAPATANRRSTAIGTDARVQRAQVSAPALPGASFPTGPVPGPGPEEAPEGLGGQSLTLETALYGAVTSNPDLVTLRNSNIASAEAVEVARRFPTTLNPTLWVDFRPIVLIPGNTFVGGSHAGTSGPAYTFGKPYYYLSLRQPIELGHQTTHRYHIAQAAYTQQQWTVVQAELLALVQTYRFFQTAAYRREKLRVAGALADFNDRLVQTLRKGLEANRVMAADVALADVENQATRQLVEVARQDYANALTDLRNQVGMPETAAAAEPLGEFALPRNIPDADETGLIQIALQSRPEIHAARAAAAGAEAAVRLARGDRIPTPIVGPEYQCDEVGVQYIGFVYITPLPVLNNGRPLVLQREADHRRALMTLQQAEQRTVTQVKSATAKWNAALRLVRQTTGLTAGLKPQVDQLERLFEANQSTLAQLLQARQRLIQLENAELDALWQATQAQADLLAALGAPCLIASLQPPGTAPAPATAAAPAATNSAPATTVR
ncbi:MAG: TolC family protein [Isosphaeraceae bacterium]|nr:TolC family protein [Isosphaeraceae bacterium]